MRFKTSEGYILDRTVRRTYPRVLWTDATWLLGAHDFSSGNEIGSVSAASATDDSGRFQVAELPPGDYSLSVTADGFQQALQQHIILHAGDRVRQNFTLIVGQHTEVAIVESDAGLVQAESAEMKDVIENQQVVDLPVRDREFLELAMLGPGVVNPPGGTRGDSLQQTGKLINILGQRTGHNLFLVDGVSVTDQYYNNVALSPSPDDTRELNIAKTKKRTRTPNSAVNQEA
jgi:hypothetical protein